MAEYNLRHAKRKEKKIKKAKNSNKALKVILLILIVTVLTFSGAYLYSVISDKKAVLEDEITFTPAHYTESISFKNSFIHTTAEGVEFINKSGKKVYEITASSVSPFVKGMSEPVMLTNDKAVLIYDIMGKSAVLFNEAGIIESYNFSGNIISGDLSKSGQFVFVVEDAGSKAAVKAFSASGSELMTWYSGKGYVADASINDKKSAMAVITNETLNGEVSSKILLFTLDNPEPYMGKVIGTTLAADVSYSGDNVFVVCENGVYHVNKDGDINSACSFFGKKMKHFSFFNNGNMLLIAENPALENYEGIVINQKGKTVSQFNVESFLDISDTDSDKFLVIKRKGVLSINQRGKIKKEIPCEFEVRDAKYLKDGIAIVSQDKIFFE